MWHVLYNECNIRYAIRFSVVYTFHANINKKKLSITMEFDVSFEISKSSLKILTETIFPMKTINILNFTEQKKSEPCARIHNSCV